MIPPISVSTALSSDIVLTSNATTQQSTIQPSTLNINSPTAIPGFSITNPTVLFQQYPTQSTHQIQKSQLNTAYHYHTQNIPISNRGTIITTQNATTTAQQAAASYRMPR